MKIYTFKYKLNSKIKSLQVTASSLRNALKCLNAKVSLVTVKRCAL